MIGMFGIPQDDPGSDSQPMGLKIGFISILDKLQAFLGDRGSAPDKK
jgi:hypothetical protein